MSFDLELTGRRALVTAGTKGVGAAVVDVLRSAGAVVVATARAIPADAHTDVHYIEADITTAAGCATVAQGARGPAYGLVPGPAAFAGIGKLPSYGGQFGTGCSGGG